MSSTIVVTYNSPTGDVDITRHVLWDQSQWQLSAGAVPGSANVFLRDLAHDLAFVTGRELSLSVDGTLVWAGYIRNIHHQYFLPADEIPDAESYEKRMWELECTDFNTLLDKRVIRNPAAYTTMDLPTFAVGTQDGAALKTLIANYIDVPAGYDMTSQVDDVGVVNPTDIGTWESQGKTLRDQCKAFARFTAPVYYVSADKRLHWHSLESVVKRWGLSDQPNNGPITADPGYQGMTRGFRECTANEDGTPITNDAMIWGGSAAATNGSMVFDREQDADSIALHNRWQIGQVHTEGGMYGNQDGVTAAARAIVFGPPGAAGDDALRGLRYAQWQFEFTWFADDVPLLSGVRDHIIPGDLVTIEMNSFGVDRLMPCRQLTIRAVGVDPQGNGIMRFTGQFALNIEDPYQLWAFLLAKQEAGTSTVKVVTVDNTSAVTVLGALYQDIPTPLPNGVTTIFSIPFGYIRGTLDVYVNGLLQRIGTDAYESGENSFTLSTAPQATDGLYVMCRTLAS